jgi:AcrR family transcriptional regulator
MARRAEAFAETRRTIVDAAIEISDARAPLSTVADRAGVSERTILRHFGSRDGLLAEAIRENLARLEAERFATPVGDVPGAVTALVGQYEAFGDRILHLLAEEGVDRQVDDSLVEGRRLHRRWVAEKLGPLLDGRDASTNGRRLAQLVAVCDVYTWKLLRRDSGLGRAETERAIRELVDAVIDARGRSAR